MLLTIAIILALLWLFGFAIHFGGNLIHLILFIALVVIIYDFVVNRRRV